LINTLDSQLRAGLARNAIEPRDLRVVELVDALENAGNQLYRLAEAFQPPDSDEVTNTLVVASDLGT
jgi:hypothetical protein